MRDLPEGVVTFLFTDVQGSTRLWEDHPDTMMGALRQHDVVIDAATEANDGVSVKPRGEGGPTGFEGIGWGRHRRSSGEEGPARERVSYPSPPSGTSRDPLARVDRSVIIFVFKRWG